MLSEPIHGFTCEFCGVSFESTEGLAEHSRLLQQPQPTLPPPISMAKGFDIGSSDS